MQADINGGLLLYVVDLYARDGPCSDSLESTAERKNDLLFGNHMRLRAEVEISKLRRQLAGQGAISDRIVLLSYRPGARRRVLKNRLACHSMARQRWHQ